MRKLHSIPKRYIPLLLCLILSTSLFAKGEEEQPQVIARAVPTLTMSDNIPVIPFNDTLFIIHTGIGSFSAKERATSIESKVKLLGSNLLFNEDSLMLVNYRGLLSITYQKNVIMSIDSLQASTEGRDQIEMAQSYREKIIKAVYQQHKNTSWQQILLQIAGTIAIIVSEYFILRGIHYLYRIARAKIRLQRGKRIKGFLGIIDDQRSVWIAISALRIIRLIFTLIFLYIGLLALFKLFPYTKHLSDELLGYIITPLRSSFDSVVNYLPDLMTIIVIVIIFVYIRKFVRSIADKVAEHKIVVRGFYADWSYPTYNIVSVLLFIFMFILIFPYLPKSDSQIFQGVSVFAGIMLSLGSTSIIGNLVAGLVITYMRPFKIGDRIKIGEFTGNVLEKTALVTRIRTPKNEIVTIPNSNVMSAQTINYSFSAEKYGLILYTSVDVGYDTPWQEVHEMLLEAADRTENLLKRQKPFVLQDAFDDFYVKYQLNVYTKQANLSAKIYSDLRQNIQDVFAEKGVEMVSPHYEVSRKTDMKDSTIPPILLKEEE